MPTKSSTTHAAWNYHVHTCCCVNVHMSSVRSGIACSVYIPSQIRTWPKTLAIILQIWCSRFDPILITRELCFGPQARPKFVTHLIKSWIRFWNNYMLVAIVWSKMCKDKPQLVPEPAQQSNDSRKAPDWHMCFDLFFAMILEHQTSQQSPRRAHKGPKEPSRDLLRKRFIFVPEATWNLPPTKKRHPNRKYSVKQIQRKLQCLTNVGLTSEITSRQQSWKMIVQG